MPHLVAVWDPTRTPDAMAETIRTLLPQARRARESGDAAALDDAYVWWGKIRSPNRPQELAHLGDVLAIDDGLRAEDGVRTGDEVHLYLTDYRALYVAHVAEITTADPRPDDPARARVPAGVYPAGVACDCWFLLWDVRRLVADDTRAVVAELRKLRNVRYEDRPVSLYGGMVELPLLVTRPDGMRFFDAETRARLTDGRLWVEFDAEQGGTGAVGASLRDDVLGERTWEALDPAARLFVATAERIWREHRGDAGFDFSPVVLNLAKAWEVQLAVALAPLRRELPEAERRLNVDGRSTDVLAEGLPGLATLARALDELPALRRACARRWPAQASWLATQLPPILRALAAARNPAAHRGTVEREDAARLRAAHLGVGQPAMLDELARLG